MALRVPPHGSHRTSTCHVLMGSDLSLSTLWWDVPAVHEDGLRHHCGDVIHLGLGTETNCQTPKSYTNVHKWRDLRGEHTKYARKNLGYILYVQANVRILKGHIVVIGV